MNPKILVVRKMSALEYYYNGNHRSHELRKSKAKQDRNIKQILRRLQKLGCAYKIVTRKDLTESLVDNYDFVFSAGGDGTVIATAAFNKDKPQLNLKTDTKSKGNLCYSNIEKAIEDFFNRDYRTEEWTRQDVYLEGNFVGRALNETAIGENMNFTKMTKYNIDLNGKQEYHRNSGLIIVTGTGSAGWPSAFSEYSKKSREFRFLTILPCEGSKKGKGDYFKIEYKGHEGKFALDTIPYDLPIDSLLEIKLSKNPLKVIKLK